MKKNFRSLFEELNGVPLQMPAEDEYTDDNFSLTDEMDHSILMHRDAHFGGDFGLMINYYNNDEHIGIDFSLDLSRIEYLAEIESQTGNNLAAELLSASEMEQVAKCRVAYVKLKEVYDLDDKTFFIPRLIADLILHEDAEPTEAIEAVVEQGTKIVPDLIHIIKSDEAYSPLFPGYGYSPYLAAVCLGKIKDPQAIAPIFEMLSQEMIFEEDALLDTFIEIGEPARDFLLDRLKGRPLTHDNDHAAFALSAFSRDLKVAEAAFDQLKDPLVQMRHLLASYLLCLCDPLFNSTHKQSFIELAKDSSIPQEIRSQIKEIVHDWH